jgi:serine/threonine protein kinase
LKLENILIQKSGHIALSDFDLADYWPPQPPDLVPPCTTKRMFGTIEYAAPEVIEGGQHTPAADWWAFGVLLYELLFGKQPYASWSQERTVHNIKHAALQLPADPLVSDDARSLISSLLRRAAAEGRAGTHDSTKRLGVKEIKRHPFFAGIDWANVWTADAEGYYRNLEPAPRNRHKAESPGVGTLQQKPWGKPA